MSFPKDTKSINYEELPSHLLYVGRGIIVACIILLLAIGWILEYKDKIVGPITVLAQELPQDVHAKWTGSMTLLVKDSSNVAKGDNLVHWDENVPLKDIKQLQQLLEDPILLNGLLKNPQKALEPIKKLHVGLLKEEWKTLNSLVLQYQDFLVNSKLAQRIQVRQDEIVIYETAIKSFNNKKLITEEIIANIESELKIKQSLATYGATAPLKINEFQKELLEKKASVEDIEFGINQQELGIKNTEKNIIDLNQEYKEKKQSYKTTIGQALNNFRVSIVNWENNHMIKAPIAGTIVFPETMTTSVYKNKGEKIATILPVNPANYYGKIQLPIKGSAKVKIGHQVNIFLDNSPSTEFGMLTGKVEKINSLSSSDDNNSRMVMASISDNISTYGIKLHLEQRQTGRAEVITSQRSFIDRILDQLYDVRLNR